MGRALAESALQRGHRVVLVSGPVCVEYPSGAEIHLVNTTGEMLEKCEELFPECDAILAAAAPCDYRPRKFSVQKLSKAGFSGTLELEETPDILKILGKRKRPDQKIIAFALETHEARSRAMKKMDTKNADFIVLNGPQALDADASRIEIYDKTGESLGIFTGEKRELAEKIVALCE